MALTAAQQSANVPRKAPGDRYWRPWILQCDASYPNGGLGSGNGYAISPSLFGLTGIDFIILCDQIDAGAQGYNGMIDPTSGNLRLFVGGGAAGTPAAEVANNTNVANVKLRAVVVGY